MGKNLKLYGSIPVEQSDMTLHALSIGSEPETMPPTPLTITDLRCAAVVRHRNDRCPFGSSVLRIVRKAQIVGRGVEGKYPVCGTHAKMCSVILASTARVGIGLTGVPER